MTVPSSAPSHWLWEQFLPPCSYELYEPECTHTNTIITNEDKIENANEQIGELIIQESFASQNGHYLYKYKPTCPCENTIHLLSCYSTINSKPYQISKIGWGKSPSWRAAPPAPPWLRPFSLIMQ